VSVRATNWAWELARAKAVQGGVLLTLLRVADHADNNGICWPGEESLSDYTGHDERTVRRHLKKLEDDKLLHRGRQVANQGRGRAFDRIHLHLDQPDNLSGNKTGDQPDKPGGSTGQSKAVQPDNSDTALYREPPDEPSGTEPPVVPQEGDIGFPGEIFELWKRLTNRNASTKFSPKRRRAIRMRLKDGHTEDEIRRAIVGCAGSDWHMKRGKHANRDGQRHDDLTFILRSTENVERFAEMAAGTPQPTSSSPISESAAATAAWEKAQGPLRAAVPESTYKIWLEPLEAAGERDGKLVLLDTSDQGGLAEWVRRRYADLVLEALHAVGGDYSGVEVVNQTDLDLEA
jgi:Helix-turn-helix domain